jgi:FkbM family methyltransferase
VCGAHSIAIEPVSISAEALQANIELNKLQDLIFLETTAVGEKNQTVSISQFLDCTNHILAEGELLENQSVFMKTLDEILGGRRANFIKVDVEGYELAVLRGAKRLLGSPHLLGLIAEMNGSGKRYGFDEDDLVEVLAAQGLLPFSYKPRTRRLVPIDDLRSKNGNILFLKNVENIRESLSSAPTFKILGEAI